MFVPRFWLYFETPGCFINTIFLLRCCENIKVGTIILILSQYCRKKVKKAWHLLPQHQSTYPRGPDSAPIEIPFQTQIHLVKVPLNVKIVKKDLLHKNSFWKMYEVRSKRVDFNWCRPLGYVLWCCGSRSQDFFTFIQTGSGHYKAVAYLARVLRVL